MRYLRESIGYVSLKEQFSKEMARIYNDIEASSMSTPEDIDSYAAENWDELHILNGPIPNVTVEDSTKEDSMTHELKERDDRIKALEDQLRQLGSEPAAASQTTDESNLEMTDPTLEKRWTLAQDSLQSLIHAGSIDNEAINAACKEFSQLYSEDDFTMDTDLALKVREGTFLNTLEFDRLSLPQRAAAIKVAE